MYCQLIPQREDLKQTAPSALSQWRGSLKAPTFFFLTWCHASWSQTHWLLYFSQLFFPIVFIFPSYLFFPFLPGTPQYLSNRILGSNEVFLLFSWSYWEFYTTMEYLSALFTPVISCWNSAPLVPSRGETKFST